MPDFRVNTAREPEFAVQVKRARTGKIESPVPEALLERHGFGIDPDLAVESFREEYERNRIANGEDTPSWHDTEIVIVTDEAAHYPTKGFHLAFDVHIATTRSQKALRMAAQMLLDIANGLDVDKSSVIGGQGIQLNEYEIKE